MNNNNEKAEQNVEQKIVKKGLNFRLLVPQLTEEYKLKVCLEEVNPKDIFQISDSSNEYLISLIKHDVRSNLPIKEKQSLVQYLKNQFSKFKI